MIPFYGANDPDMFAIERRAMDPAGLVIEAIASILPVTGLVADIGAGDGHAARKLETATRRIIPIEPARGMIAQGPALRWVQASAEALPLADGALDAAYATWAYFFPTYHDPTPGLDELHRAVQPGGSLVIADNLDDDEFTALAPGDITTDPAFWIDQGFECRVVDTTFEFDDLDSAATLLGFYFGEAGRRRTALRFSYRVGLFVAKSRGT